jgi:CBS domain-containing protein
VAFAFSSLSKQTLPSTSRVRPEMALVTMTLWVAGALVAPAPLQRTALGGRLRHSHAPCMQTGGIIQRSAWPGSQNTVGDFMSTTVLSIEPTKTISDAAQIMNDKRVTGLAVVDAGRLVGIISRSDLLRVVAMGSQNPNAGWVIGDDGRATYYANLSAASPGQLIPVEMTPIWRCMNHNPITVRPETTILEAAKIMFPSRLNRLMVVNEAEQLIGIVTSTDVMRTTLCT